MPDPEDLVVALPGYSVISVGESGANPNRGTRQQRQTRPTRSYRPGARRLGFGFARPRSPRPRGIAGISHAAPEYTRQVSATADQMAVGAVWGELVSEGEIPDLPGKYWEIPRLQAFGHERAPQWARSWQVLPASSLSSGTGKSVRLAGIPATAIAPGRTTEQAMPVLGLPEASVDLGRAFAHYARGSMRRSNEPRMGSLIAYPSRW
jgi:hypothetical protein